jgi:preprotein translocase subunit SecF
MRILANPHYNFIRWRWHALALSVAIIVAGLVTTVSRGGPRLGVDFTGGTVVELDFAQPVDENAVRRALGALGNDASIQRFGDADRNSIMIRLPLGDTQEQGASLDVTARRVVDAVRTANLGEFTTRSTDIVGPTIGRDLQSKGIWATLTALGGILIYIAIRFRLTFALGAVVATFHDIAITLIFLTWAGFDLTLNIVAAILTIAGYSVNDTIVVFDRVRENQRVARREPLEKLVNDAVNQTLSRTIVTAGTTFVAVLSLYLFGGEVLRGFGFAMLVGILSGTYSTVFIASAVAIVLGGRAKGNAATPAEARRRARA